MAEHPVLEALTGPCEGSVFPIEDEVSIGREPSNVISVLDSAVSRRHCVLRRAGDDVELRDLGSRNNTYVNGVPVHERTLRDRDEIKVGASVFRFRGAGQRMSKSSSVELRQEESAAGPTVVLRREDARYLKRETLPPTVRTVRDLEALLRVSSQINSVRGLTRLQTSILEAVIEVAPADRAAILLGGSSPEEFASVAGLDRMAGTGAAVQVSRTVVRRVFDEGVAVLSNEVSAAEAYQKAQSLIAPQVNSVLAVPLAVLDRIVGVLYLDTSDPRARFDEDLLQLMTAIGNIAALALENARRMEWLEGENRRLAAEIAIEHNMVGDSPAIRQVYDTIARVAARESTVLIQGESGTGKELVARAIHRNSERSEKPFVAINCAAIPENLLESELFGHEKGAFTGAVAQRQGKLETAEGGTVFLDEIGELAGPLQGKLLRVLQEREFERIGGRRPIPLDIRLIAATNRDLKAAARKNEFREDLYYRLNVVSIKMPALRERREDIPALVRHFAEKYSARVKRPVSGVSPKALAALMRYDWPGNVRELENAIERAVVMGATDEILPEDLPEAVLEPEVDEADAGVVLYDGVREAKKQLIEKAIADAGGNFTEAAAILGVHPNHLHRLVRNLGLKPKRQRRA